eukprot:273225-Rhodomonas_salina.1
MRALPPAREQEPTEEEWAILALIREQRARAAGAAGGAARHEGRCQPRTPSTPWRLTSSEP